METFIFSGCLSVQDSCYCDSLKYEWLVGCRIYIELSWKLDQLIKFLNACHTGMLLTRLASGTKGPFLASDDFCHYSIRACVCPEIFASVISGGGVSECLKDLYGVILKTSRLHD